MDCADRPLLRWHVARHEDVPARYSTRMNDEANPMHAAGRLMAAIEAKRAPVCVGLDPVLEKLPKSLQPGRQMRGSDAVDAVERLCAFCHEVIAAVSESAPCIKIQAGCFERYSSLGWIQLWEDLLQDSGTYAECEIILDAKRGDIGVTAEHYAAGIFGRHPVEGGSNPDWLTINSYLGEDGITPFLKYPRHGAFALVRTSNPGGDQVQNLELKDGRTVAHAVGEMIARIGSDYLGERGYSSLGAVVGATKPHDAKRLREIMPQQIFLVPGYGAQGGGIDDVLPCFKSDGSGAIVTASRSIIYAFKPDDPKWADSVADAAAKFAEGVGRAVGMR